MFSTLSLLANGNSLWKSYVLDVAIKQKSLWQSYALAAATQESVWKSYIGDVAVNVLKQERFMEKICSLPFPYWPTGTAYGKVTFLLVLPHRKAHGLLAVIKQKAYGNVMFWIAAIRQESLWKVMFSTLSLLASENSLWKSYVLDVAIKQKSVWESYVLAAATQERLWNNSIGDVAVNVVKQEWFMEKLCS